MSLVQTMGYGYEVRAGLLLLLGLILVVSLRVAKPPSKVTQQMSRVDIHLSLIHI